MASGELDQRIAFERELLTTDELGGNGVAWLIFMTVWAKVEPLSGRERDMAQQTESPRNYRIKIRRTTATEQILAKDRITWLGKVLNIRFISEASGRPLYLTIDAEEGVAT